MGDLEAFMLLPCAPPPSPDILRDINLNHFQFNVTRTQISLENNLKNIPINSKCIPHRTLSLSVSVAVHKSRNTVVFLRQLLHGLFHTDSYEMPFDDH